MMQHQVMNIIKLKIHTDRSISIMSLLAFANANKNKHETTRRNGNGGSSSKEIVYVKEMNSLNGFSFNI